VLGVVGDAVEDGFFVDHLIGGQQSAEVDPGDNVAVAGRDAGDAVVVPDVRINLALDVLQLVEFLDRSSRVPDDNVASLCESRRVAETERRAAVAGDDFAIGAGHAPALAGVLELLDRPQREAVVDEADMRLPGPLVDVRAPVDDTFAKILRRQCRVLADLPGGGVDRHQLRVAFEARAFVEKAVEVEEALRVAARGVRILRNDLVAVDRSGGVAGRRRQGGAEDEAGENIVQAERKGAHLL